MAVQLDNTYNLQQYDNNVNYFKGLGFNDQLAANYAASTTANNLQYDAGELPEVTVTATRPYVHYIKDDSRPGVARVKYNAYQGHQNELDAQKAANKVGAVIGGAMLAPVAAHIVAPMIANPLTTIGAAVGGSVGSQTTDSIINIASNGKYNDFSNMMNSVTGRDDTFMWNMLNPGGLLGGSLGGAVGYSSDLFAKGVISPATKIIRDVALKNGLNWKNFRFLGDRRFAKDMLNDGAQTWIERQAGNYPLTSAERRNWITNVKNDVLKGENFIADQYRNNPFFETLPTDAQTVSTFGTRSALNNYGGNPKSASDFGFIAYYHPGPNKTFFPFRYNSNTLRTNQGLHTTQERVGNGAHEFKHYIQHKNTGLSQLPTNANSSLVRRLPESIASPYLSIVRNSGTNGSWEGMLTEMDSELAYKLAQTGTPKYSLLTNAQKNDVLDYMTQRFWRSPNNQGREYTMKNFNTEWSWMDDFTIPGVDKLHSPQYYFDNLFKGMEANYYKQGGKIINYLDLFNYNGK